MIDAHVHLGSFPEKTYTEEDLKRDIADAGCDGAVVFAFPEDMYRVEDSPERRKQAHEYILDVAGRNPDIHPFYFVWRYDETPDELSERYKGIKWHRHADEPEYDYTSQAFRDTAALIDTEKMPVTLEEERKYTYFMLEHLRNAPIIIPHCGRMNGGFQGLRSLLDSPNVYFDTSVAPLDEVKTALHAVGPHRLIFGSDVSGTQTPFFNLPKVELKKLDALGLSEEDRALVTRENIMRIMGRGKRYQLAMSIQVDDAPTKPKAVKGYVIRTFQLDDETAWVRVMDGNLGEWDLEKAGKAIFSQPQFDPEEMFFVVEEATDTVVGTACLWKKPDYPPTAGELHMVAVDPAHSGKRLGEMVSLAVIKAAKKKGLEEIRLTTDDWRLPAAKTYLRMGFKPVLNVRYEDHTERWRELKRQLGK